MARRPKTVPKSKIEELDEALTAKAKAPKTITLEELVKHLAKPIEAMLHAGYNYEDISEVFQEQGVDLAASGIKSWHRKSQSQPDEPVVENSRQTHSSDSEIPAEKPVEEPIEEPVKEPVEDSEVPTAQASVTSVRSRSNKSRFNSLDRSTL